MVAEWLKEKDRRKLKKLPPISATVASSSLPSTTAVPDHPPPLDEATAHDLDLPSSMEVDDPQSSNSEPNVDAYVVALQLEWKILTTNQTISLISYKVSSIDNSLLQVVV